MRFSDWSSYVCSSDLQNGMARTMGLLSRPAGRLPPPRRLQARLAALLLREQFVELLLVGVVVEEVVQLLARLQAVDDVLLRAIAAHGFVEAERGLEIGRAHV